MSDLEVDVLIIGAGWSGLVCGHNCLKQGLSILILEKREDLGGVYNFSEDPSIPTVSEITELNSSRLVTQISDFPYSESDVKMGDFPNHWNVYKYLKNFAIKNDLLKYIKFNVNVIKCDKSCNNIWNTTTSNCNIFRSKYVVCCNGLANIGKEIPSYLSSSYKGTLINGHNIKKLDKYFHLVKDKNLLIIGGGDTAADFALHFHPFTKNTYWSIRNGQQFFKKRGEFFGSYNSYLNKAIVSYDTIFTPLINIISPMNREKPGMTFGCKYSTSGDILSYDNHGIYEWKSNKKYMAINLNKSSDVIKYVKMGYIIAKGDIINVNNKQIQFNDNTIVNDIDIIIFCAGYKSNINFFIDKKLNNISNAYEFVFNCYDTSVAYIGYVRPVLYSIPFYSELNSRWLSLVWSNKLKLPSKESILQTHQNNLKERETYFGTHISNKYPTIVDGLHYEKIIKKLNLFQIISSKLNIFEKAYYFCFATIQTPWLHVLDYDDSAIKNNDDLIEKIPSIQETGFDADIFDYTFGIISLLSLLRLTQFDTICYYIQEFRYCLQKYQWFKYIERNIIICQHYLVEKKILPHDSNVYFTYNPSISPKVIKYYNAIVLDPTKENENSLERVSLLKYGLTKFIIFYICCVILFYFFFF